MGGETPIVRKYSNNKTYKPRLNEKVSIFSTCIGHDVDIMSK